ncbi:metallophosphoesterase [Devosia faecipullorum]|uniref:metallophosphoesterase n=1 Tax=Devosia faecipullorum TaxID=2755039 RepID=UPI00187B4000|nr:metallophosphoesterase [Devosia faecipullorum]MBE7732195.1 metallophosphoesterase family protein [Devosia faecipullorum]
MMIWIVSDLHMDSTYWVPDRTPGHDVMIVAGDVDKSAADTEQTLLMLERWSPSPIIFVPGNHDVMGVALDAWDRNNEDLFDRGIHVISSGQSVVLNDVRFVGGTLWTDFGLADDRYGSESWAARHMPEYQRVVRSDGSPIWPADTSAAHANHRAAIEAVLAQPFAGPTVVVTHHAPSRRSIAGAVDLADAAFASDLEQMIMRHQPELWVHGHVHQHHDYRIGNTRILANPRGYQGPDHGEDSGFVEDLVVEVGEVAR